MNHFAENPPQIGDADTVLDMIYWEYAEHNNIDNDNIKKLFKRLREIVPLNGREFDEVLYLVCDLSLEYGRLSFIGGCSIGIKLMSEASDKS